MARLVPHGAARAVAADARAVLLRCQVPPVRRVVERLYGSWNMEKMVRPEESA